MEAQACKIALEPVKILFTGQQNLTIVFLKLNSGPVDLTVHCEDWVRLLQTMFCEYNFSNFN